MTTSGLGSRRRLAVISSNFWPEMTGISQTVGEFTKYAVDAGLEVAVATAMPFYPQWRIWPQYEGRLGTVERSDGLTTYRSWHFVRPNPSTLTRLLHEATLALFGLPNMIRTVRGAACVYVVSPALTYACLGLLLGKIYRVRRVLVVKDVMPDAAVDLGMLRNPILVALSRLLARWAYGVADEIHILGEGMRRRIVRETRSTAKIRIVPDTIDGHELRPIPSSQNEFRRRFVPPGSFAVLHTGNMGKKQDLDLLLRAARHLKGDPDVRFIVVGDGAVKDDFLRLRDEWGLDNVTHHPLQERWMVPHMLSGADVVIVSQLPEVVDIVVPSKLIAALGAGAMIVAACASESETARLVRESGGGIVVGASDDVALADAIRRVKAGAVDTEGHRQQGRDFALRHFERGAVYGALVQELLTAG